MWRHVLELKMRRQFPSQTAAVELCTFFTLSNNNALNFNHNNYYANDVTQTNSIYSPCFGALRRLAWQDATGKYGCAIPGNGESSPPTMSRWLVLCDKLVYVVFWCEMGKYTGGRVFFLRYVMTYFLRKETYRGVFLLFI